MLHCKVAFVCLIVNIQSYFFHRFLNTAVCDWREKKGPTYNIMQHFMHFEVERMYNFKFGGVCVVCFVVVWAEPRTVYKMHKPNSKSEQLLILCYCCCASNRSLSCFNFQVAAWIQCYKRELRSFVLVCDNFFFYSVLTRSKKWLFRH